MSKSLVIVESPAKAKTIGKYLGKGFAVMASVGHIKDLPKSKLGVDIEHDFEPTYEVIKGKKKVVDDIKKAAEKAEAIYLALDPDREGEAIAWHVADEIRGLGGKKKKGTKKAKADDEKPIHRILFNEITKNAIREAIQKPLELDGHLYEAQQARRILDRLVGYQISPLLWDKVRRGLSAGRVQSVAVRLICEREREIRAFKPEEYWSIHARLSGSVPPEFEAKLAKIDGKKETVGNEAQAKAIVRDLEAGRFLLRKIVKQERRRHPTPPFITSKLQQEAARKLGYTAKRTMAIAQQLYEGVELGEEGSVGLITYMRTDSTRIADSALTEARELIAKQYGAPYLPEQPHVYKSKKGAQDAHEAIRPTSANYLPEAVKEFLTAEQYKLYRLIWQRFVASQMTSAVLDQTAFEIENGRYELRANGSQIRFDGFIRVYTEGVDEKPASGEEEEGEGGLLPDLKEGETLANRGLRPDQHFTEPPPRYTEASLIKELEEKGIGRPSTYAAILSNIQDREYVKKEQTRFYPADLGFIVNDLLVENFPTILNVEFTARMEGELDEVEEGKRTYLETLKDFYKPFEETLARAKEGMKNVKRQEIATDLTCEQCKSPLVIKWGRRGEFLACTNYPECKYTREFVRDIEGKITLAKREVTGAFCANCGSQMIIKSGRFGKFLACSKYPECKTTQPLTTGIPCPECGQGQLTERRTKKGRSFYGCNKYPNCKFATWDKPLKEACPKCGNPYLVAKGSRKTGTAVIKCPKEGCDYAREAAS